MNTQQLLYKLEFKRFCIERAVSRGDYHAANIFAQQAEYLEEKLGQRPASRLTGEGVNEPA